jgi:hypothetical protein
VCGTLFLLTWMPCGQLSCNDCDFLIYSLIKKMK